MSTSSAMDLVTGKTESWSVNETSKTNETGLPYSLPEMTLIAIVAGFLSLLTVVGNCMVMISFKIDKQLQTISNYFLFSLAVADFAIGLISMPLYTMYILTGSWQLGPHMCDTWLSLDYLASNASVLNLLIISFDRYFSVTRPLTYRARRTPRRAGIMIAAAWLISLVLWPPWIYSWPHIEGKRTVPEGECYIQFIETNNYITFGTAIAAFYVPVTVMCILYWKVWRETEKRQKDLSNLQAGKKNDSHRSNSSNEEQAAIEIDEWRRSRSESSGAIDEIETTYVPASAYLTGIRKRRQRMAGWRNIRNWRRFLSWSYLRRLVWCRGRHQRTSYEDESYSDVSNAATPGSVETPLASTISHGVSVNAIRDPYSHPRHRLASRSQSTGVADPLGSPDGDTLGNRAQSADSVFTILIRLPRDPDKEEHPTIRMIPANPPHRPKPSQAYHPPASRPRSVPLGPPPPGPASNNSKFMSNSSSLLCGTNLQLTEAFSLSKLTSLAKPNHLPLKGAKLKSNASPWVPRSCMPVAQSPLLPRSTSRFPGDGSNRPSDNSALPLDAKIIPRQLASRPVSTVSGNVSAPQTPNRRNRYQVHNPQALAKKNGKKPKKKKNQEKKQERKAAKTLSAILLAFILTWTPYSVLILLKALAKCDDDCFPQQLWNFSYYLCYINSTINPVCYALCNASFRRTYVRILTCKWHSRTKTAVQRGFYN